MYSWSVADIAYTHVAILNVLTECQSKLNSAWTAAKMVRNYLMYDHNFRHCIYVLLISAHFAMI